MHTFINSVLNYAHRDGLTILPEMELLLLALGILIIDFLLGKGRVRFRVLGLRIDFLEKHLIPALAMMGVAASALGVYTQYNRYTAVVQHDPRATGLLGFQGTVLVDGFFIVFAGLFLAATALVILLSVKYLDIEKEQEGEYYALILLSCIGMMLMASGFDLIVLFLGLETMALSFYVMTGFLRANKRSNEAAMKYILLGAFSSGILAYGFSLLYGASGAAVEPGRVPTPSTNIGQIGYVLGRRLEYTLAHGMTDWLVVLAFVTIATGLFFKIAAVPFHQWAPDVYEGAPTPITAYVSVASKTASFALFLRLMLTVFSVSQDTWIYLVAGVAIASLTWGNLAALTQTNIKRLLAYSSISHVGYILLGVVAGNERGLTGMVYYLIAYAFMTLGAFAVVIVMRQRGLIGDELDDLDGLYQRSPAAALLLLVFMLSLAGIPTTAGFIGKYYIFQALIETHHPVLAVFGALYIVPALYYYFRVVVHAWLKAPGDAPAPQMSNGQAIALGVTLFVTLAAGLYPEPFAQVARYAFAFGQ